MKTSEAIDICNTWFAYKERQKAKSVKIQELAAKARRSPEDAKEAQRELKQLDRSPVVYDGARLEPAVRHLVEKVRRDDG